MPRSIVFAVVAAVAVGGVVMVVRARTSAPVPIEVVEATPEPTALRDGAQVYVPRHGETPPAGSVGSGSERKVDINRATSAELESLPGIGPSTAARIVRARDLRAFTKVEELQTRGLVSARVLSDIRDLVTTR